MESVASIAAGSEVMAQCYSNWACCLSVADGTLELRGLLSLFLSPSPALPCHYFGLKKERKKPPSHGVCDSCLHVLNCCEEMHEKSKAAAKPAASLVIKLSAPLLA